MADLSTTILEDETEENRHPEILLALWFWDSRRRIYIDRFGDRLTDKEIREALDEYIESTQEGIAHKIAAGLSTTALFNLLEEEVTALHGASGAIAYGGLEQMDSEKWDRIENRLVSELGYLAQFKADVRAAASAGVLSRDAITARAQLYPEAAYSEYVNQVVERESDNGITLGRRICEADGASCEECVDAATEEFIPLDEIPDIGSLQCMNNCRCEIEFSVDGDEFRTSDVFQGVISGQEAFGGSEVIQ